MSLQCDIFKLHM